MKHTRSSNYYIVPLTGEKVTIPQKKENETYTETMYRTALEKTKQAIDTGMASFCGGQYSGFTKSNLSMDF